MNAFRTETTLSEILRILESVTAALRSADLDGSMRLQARAVDLLRSRAFDCGERMVLDKVLGRLRKVSPGSSVVLGIEECLVGS